METQKPHRPNLRYTDEQILEAMRTSQNYEQGARSLGMDPRGYIRRVRKLEAGEAPAQPVVKDTIEPLVYFPDRKPARLDWEAVLERHGDIAAKRDREDPKQLRATVDLTAHDGPICIMQMSDVHIGSPQCDVKTLIAHIKMLKTIPNLYCILDGDFTEWAISPRMLDAVLGQVGAPQEQVRVLQAMLEDLSSKIVAVVTGNHDERGVRMGGVDVFEFILMKVADRGVYLRDGGVLTIKLQGVDYSWRVSHGDGLRGNSMYSNTSALTRNARHEMGFTDVASAGHTHDPEVKVIYEPRAGGAPKEESVYIRSGSYKVLYGENYVDRQGYNPVPDVVMPAVVLWPGTNRKLPFLKVESAVEYLSAFESKKRKGKVA